MKWKMLFGALVVSAGLCSQSYGGHLLERMLGMRGGCCESDCCETSCCEAEATCAVDDGCCGDDDCCGNEASCGAADDCCGDDSCCDSGCGRKRCRIDLFAGLKGLFDCGRCNSGCDDSCCEEASCGVADDCCGSDSCCDSGCGRRGGFLRNLFRCKKSCNSCCEDSCCESTCAAVDAGCSGGHDHHDDEPEAADEDEGDDAPAPMADPTASIGRRHQRT